MFLHKWHLHIWPVRGGEMGPDYRDAFRLQTASLYNLEIQIQVQIHDMMGPYFTWRPLANAFRLRYLQLGKKYKYTYMISSSQTSFRHGI